MIELDFRDGGALPPDLLRRLDALADRDRDNFNRLIGELSHCRERDIDWWVSNPASRNVHISCLFRQCMQLALVRALLDEGNALRVLVSQPELAGVLRQAGDRVTVVETGRFHARLKQARMHGWNVASSVFHTGSAVVAAKLTRHLRRPRRAGPIRLVDCYVTKDSFDRGVFRDRHFPGLMSVLSDEEREEVYYNPIVYRLRHYLGCFRAMRRDPGNFLVREDFLRWADYRFAFGHWWRIRRLAGRQAEFAGFAIGPLVDRDLRNGRFAQSAVLALLLYRFFRHAGERGLRLSHVLTWYEGRDIDHAIAAAINWTGLPVDVAGFRPLASRFYLSVSPVRHEVQAGVVPRRMAVVGTRFRTEIAAVDRTLETSVAPGLRQSQLPLLPRHREEGAPAVLVLLPLAREMVSRVRQLVVPTETEARDGVRWWIKRHPEMPKAEFETEFGTDLPPGFSFIEGNFQDWLSRASLVAGTATSTLIDAVGTGTPALCLAAGNEPTENPIPPWVDARLWRTCYSLEETRACVQEMLGRGETPVDLDQLQEDLFSPGRPERMGALLGFPPQRPGEPGHIALDEDRRAAVPPLR